MVQEPAPTNCNPNKTSMETPPSTPPAFTKPAPGAAVLSPESPQRLSNKGPQPSQGGGASQTPQRARSDSLKSQDAKSLRTPGHSRDCTPSTPQAYAEVIPSGGTNSIAPRGDPFRVSATGQSAMPPTLTADLTPVIRNSNVAYVDHPSSSAIASGKRLPGFVVVSPAMMSDGHGLNHDDDLDNSQHSLSSSSRSRDSKARLRRLSSGGLKQRRLPPPRSSLPPMKRSSGEAIRIAEIGSGAITSGGGTPVPSMTPASPNTPATSNSEGTDGLGDLLGEGLSMPSGLYSDESSIENEKEPSGKASRVGNIHLASSAFRPGKEGPKKIDHPPELAPIELKPDRKFFSFSGTSQYKRTIEVSTKGPEGGRLLETIHSPARRPPVPPTKDGRPREQPGHSIQDRQYQPSERGAHGVSEMADTKDLDAIFKAPRNTPRRAGNSNATGAVPLGGHPMVVDAFQPILSSHSINPADSTGSADQIATRTIEVPAFLPPSDDDDRQDNQLNDALRNPIPIDDRQWSIPSIRLANHINRESSMHSFHTLSDDEYTEEASLGNSLDASMDDSLNDSLSYLADGDNDEGSVSSKESFQPIIRRWRMSSELLRRSNTATSSTTNNTNHTANTASSADSSSIPPHVVPVTPLGVAPPSLTRMTSEPTASNISSAFKINKDIGDREEGVVAPPSLTRMTSEPASRTTSNSSNSGIPAIGPGTSSLVRNMDRISIAQTKMAFTFDDEENLTDPVTTTDPGANISALYSVDDAAVDYYSPEHPQIGVAPPLTNIQGQMAPNSEITNDAFVSQQENEGAHVLQTTRARSSRRRHGRRSRHSGRRKRAAFEWLHDLQNQPSDGILIAEAASSKFLTGGHGGGTGGFKSGFEEAPPAPQDSEQSSPQDLSHALGMPHPLCRSSTITLTDQFVRRTGFGFAQGNSSCTQGESDRISILGASGGNTAIALTSSGSS